MLSLDGRVGEDARRLLEAGRGEERLGRKRGFGDAEQDRPPFGQLLAVCRHALVLLGKDGGLDQLPRQHLRIAAVYDLDLAQHRANDRLDVLVVDVDALRAIDALHLLNEVLLERVLALVLEDFVRIERAFIEPLADLDALTFLHRHVGVVRNVVGVLLTAVVGDDHDPFGLLFGNVHGARHERHRGLALGFARFEDFLDARQTRDDVLGGDAAGVEGAKRQLGTRLADRLRGDDADRLADVDALAGREVTAIAHRAHAVFGLAGEHRANLHR